MTTSIQAQAAELLRQISSAASHQAAESARHSTLGAELLAQLQGLVDEAGEALFPATEYKDLSDILRGWVSMTDRQALVGERISDIFADLAGRTAVE